MCSAHSTTYRQNRSIPAFTSRLTTRSTIAQMAKSSRRRCAPGRAKPLASSGSNAGIIPGAKPQGYQPSAISAVSAIIFGPTAATGLRDLGIEGRFCISHRDGALRIIRS
jgi:hypothetical protein